MIRGGSHRLLSAKGVHSMDILHSIRQTGKSVSWIGDFKDVTKVIANEPRFSVDHDRTDGRSAIFEYL
jgi:hypothetical protein